MGRAVSCFLVGLGVLVFGVASAGAVPMEYVFTGEVSRLNGGSLDGVEVGTPVTLTVLIDFSREPALTTVSDPSPNPQQIDYFYAELSSASSLVTTLLSLDVALFNSFAGFGVDIPYGDPGGSYGSLFSPPNTGSGYGDSLLYILSTDKPVSDWSVGDALRAGQFGGAAYPSVGYQLELASVTGASAVPEPSTLVLLGSGLLGLARLRRRSKSPERPRRLRPD